MIGTATKRPVTINFCLWDGENLDEVIKFCAGNATYELMFRGNSEIVIQTLEDGADKIAQHVASKGDYIIQGVQGEFYPCKPDIFEATYLATPAAEQGEKQHAQEEPQDLRNAVTLSVWNRFAPEYRATFSEEPHKAEYRFAAEEVIALVRKYDADYQTAELILRDVCEFDPAAPEMNDTICIDISDLSRILRRHIKLVPAEQGDAKDAQRYRWLVGGNCVSDRLLDAYKDWDGCDGVTGFNAHIDDAILASKPAVGEVTWLP